MTEKTKPIAVKGPTEAPMLFWSRQAVDLQLKTIASAVIPWLKENASTGTILDIGAGESPWNEFMGESIKYQGVDIVTAGSFGMKNSELISYYDGETIPFDAESFDAAMSIEVIEHARNPQRLINEANRVLKKGGAFLATIPWSARLHHTPFDYNRFTPWKLNEMFKEAGFENIEIKPRGDNVCTVANKLILITWALFSEKGIANLFRWPLACMVLPCAIIATLAAQVTIIIGTKLNDDPLGFVITCSKK